MWPCREWLRFHSTASFLQELYCKSITKVSQHPWQIFRVFLFFSDISSDFYSQDPLWYVHSFECHLCPTSYFFKKSIPSKYVFQEALLCRTESSLGSSSKTTTVPCWNQESIVIYPLYSRNQKFLLHRSHHTPYSITFFFA